MAHTYWACEPCDIGWYGADGACWSCGREGDPLSYSGVNLWRSGFSLQQVRGKVGL